MTNFSIKNLFSVVTEIDKFGLSLHKNDILNLFTWLFLIPVLVDIEVDIFLLVDIF